MERLSCDFSRLRRGDLRGEGHVQTAFQGDCGEGFTLRMDIIVYFGYTIKEYSSLPFVRTMRSRRPIRAPRPRQVRTRGCQQSINVYCISRIYGKLQGSTQVIHQLPTESFVRIYCCRYAKSCCARCAWGTCPIKISL